MSELIDRQAVISKIEPWLYTEGRGESELNMLRAVLEILKGQPTASPWHRVEEELPKIGQIVLVYDDWDRLSICQLDNQYRWLRQGGGRFDVQYVRYWMPIEPPKEDA